MRKNIAKVGFMDGIGQFVRPHDKVKYEFQEGIFEVLDIFQDGDASIKKDDGRIFNVKWIYLTKMN